MHIPDGFLSPPVWVGLDLMAAPAVAVLAHRARRDGDESRIPLLGVMGAFVFAAQMINFPVGPGTSGHLVGGTLLAIALGPAAATVVMTAILAIQAFVFQDGGVVVLGANIMNMAIAGVFAGYLPYAAWGQTRFRQVAIFAGAALSVMVSASLALSELLISGVRMPAPILWLSIGLFAVSAALEGAITLAVVRGIERLHPAWIQRSVSRRSPAFAAIAMVAVALATAGFLFASTSPDGLQHLASQLGLTGHHTIQGPLAEYEIAGIGSVWLRRAAAGLTGVLLIYIVCALLGRAISRRRRRPVEEGA